MNDVLTAGGLVIGRITGATEDGRPLVAALDDGGVGTAGTDAAACDVAWMQREPRWEACLGLRVAIGVPHGAAGADTPRPLVLALLDAPPADALHPAPEPPAAPARGKALRIASDEELVLECGKSKIALRADGRITILGGYVLSRSTGVNKLQGGAVHIN